MENTENRVSGLELWLPETFFQCISQLDSQSTQSIISYTSLDEQNHENGRIEIQKITESVPEKPPSLKLMFSGNIASDFEKRYCCKILRISEIVRTKEERKVFKDGYREENAAPNTLSHKTDNVTRLTKKTKSKKRKLHHLQTVSHLESYSAEPSSYNDGIIETEAVPIESKDVDEEKSRSVDDVQTFARRRSSRQKKPSTLLKEIKGEFLDYDSSKVCESSLVSTEDVEGLGPVEVGNFDLENNKQKLNVEIAECEICGKTLARNRLAVHVQRAHQKDNNFENYISRLKAETKRKTIIRNDQCNLCKRWFTSKKNLSVHISIKHPKESAYLNAVKGNSKVICMLCGASVVNLHTHTERCHSEKLGSYHCDECFKAYNSEQLLKEHKYRVHQLKERHLCHLCPRSFKHARYLQDHIQDAHIRNKHYECDECHKVVTTAKTLYKHKKTHTGKKSHTCAYCGKGFFEGPNMRRHVRLIHETNSVERVQCPECDKTFTLKSNLKQHMDAVHNHQFTYKCSLCHRGFYRRNKLEEHMKSHEPFYVVQPSGQLTKVPTSHVMDSTFLLPSSNMDGVEMAISSLHGGEGNDHPHPTDYSTSEDNIQQELLRLESSADHTQPIHTGSSLLSGHSGQMSVVTSESETMAVQQTHSGASPKQQTITLGEGTGQGQEIKFIFIPADNAKVQNLEY
ncbi:zinc finger protein 286A isoform X2 [Lingula anatina]|uniref:Zinc finger protein 286A isoform X2 n=1 Tax=Lingula anatina TaxID=7574 RepID=A0A1S3IJ41_LINAN|nr:zinc finger protein 286A isoform X2 [Lingula anatina]|eukprot:XP_013397519.1 zinc finger protein 286A isoform X2 [Lingula anatina]